MPIRYQFVIFHPTRLMGERFVHDCVGRGAQTATSQNSYTPAMGRFTPTGLYDPVVALTRERLWRALAVMHAMPRPGDVIIYVGCGTGSLALLLARVEPGAHITGVDPDPDVLDIARRKAPADAGVRWHVGMGDALVDVAGADTADTVVSSLVLHQCPMPMKRAILASMFAVLRAGGRFVIADYGWQRSTLMRLAFRIVQLADGKEDTEPNARGVLPELMLQAGRGCSCEVRRCASGRRTAATGSCPSTVRR
jgi:SAM-dependent methyltransferase